MPIKNRPCAYCGCTDVPREKGHVLPRFLYPTTTAATVQRITVPECQRCKMLWQDAEEPFANILTVAGEPNDAVIEQWNRVFRDFSSRKRRLEDLWANLRPINIAGQQLARLFYNMADQLKDGLRMTIKSMIAEGDSVAIEAESLGELKNGRVYNQQYHILISVRDGKISAVREYLDTQHVFAIWFQS